MEADSFYLDTQGVYRVRALDQFELLEHGFGTALSPGWPDPSRLAMLKQTHSAAIVAARGASGFIGQGDALVTDQPGQMVGVRTADCVPILLVDGKARAVAAVHAGWRGTAQQIAGGAVAELAARFGTKPQDVYAAIGPAIGACCYEVGPEVAAAFTQWWPEFDGVTGRVKLDLIETNRLQLIDAGLAGDRIFTGAPCTAHTATLHSYRRDKEAAGRMISAIGIR